MALATSVSPPGRGSYRVRDLHNPPCAPVTFISALSLFLSLVPFFSRRLSPSSHVYFPVISSSFWVWVHPSSFPLPILLFFFLEVAPSWRGGGKTVCSFMGGNKWTPVVGRGQ